MSHTVIEYRKCTHKHSLFRMINTTNIECISGALADGVVMEIIGSVQVIIDDATVTREGVTFEYKEDPVFERLVPQKTIPS